MNARFTHAVFDLDGTILNTLEDLACACNYVCELHGWPTFPLDAYRYKVGNGMLKLVERIMPAEYLGDETMFAQVLAEFHARYAEHKEDHTAPYLGGRPLGDSLDQLGADPQTVLYVGDSNVDVQTGHNAGLLVAGAAWGFRGATELEAAGADFILEHPDELIALTGV